MFKHWNSLVFQTLGASHDVSNLGNKVFKMFSNVGSEACSKVGTLSFSNLGSEACSKVGTLSFSNLGSEACSKIGTHLFSNLGSES